MDKMELTEQNLKKVLVETYARAVAMQPNVEDGYRVLNPDEIRVFIYEDEVTVDFPCLQCQSMASVCARLAAEETSRHFFGDPSSPGKDWNSIVGNIPEHELNLKTSVGRFVWRHHF